MRKMAMAALVLAFGLAMAACSGGGPVAPGTGNGDQSADSATISYEIGVSGMT